MKSRKRKAGRYSKEHVDTASGVAWYDRAQWQRLRQVAADPERLEDSYDEWIAMAENAIRELEATGMLIEKVPVDTEDLIAWCNERDRPIDGAARAEYASQRLREIHLSE
jgi:hypothetical protein